MGKLTGQTIAASYDQLLIVDDANGISSSLQAVESADTGGSASALQISTVAAAIDNPTTSSATQGGKLTLFSDDGAALGDTHRLGVLEFSAAEDSSSTITIGARIEAIADAAWSASENGADMVFYTTDGNASQTEVMRLTGTGSAVGIGTAAPTEALTVSYGIGTESTLTGVLAIEGTDTEGANMVSGSGPSLDFRIPTSTTATHVAARIGCPREGGDEDANAGTLSFYTASTDDATATEKMTILKGGNVGISTKAPSGLLHCVKDGTYGEAYFTIAHTSASSDFGLKLQKARGSIGGEAAVFNNDIVRFMEFQG